MDWSRMRIFSAVAGAVLGAALGVVALWVISLFTGQDPVLNLTGVGVPMIAMATVLANAAVSNSTFARASATIAERAPALATGAVRTESAPAKVRRVLGKRTGAVATMLLPPHQAAGRFVELSVLPAHSAPCVAYALVPAHYSLQRDAPAAVVLDPQNPGIVLLDDRIQPSALAAIAADPRWKTTRFPSQFVAQGGVGMAIALGAGFALTILGGILLNMLL